MSIIKEILLTSGIQVTYHKIVRVNLTQPEGILRAAVLVSSWANQEQYDLHKESVHTQVYDRVLIEPTTNIFTDLETYLTSVDTDSVLYGGTIVADNIIIPLEALKASRWAMLKNIRDKIDTGTFTWNTHEFDCDEPSKVKLTLAAIKAVRAVQSNEVYTEYWTLADNSVIALTAEEMILVVEALGAHIRDTHIMGVTLRMAIETATTEEEVLAVVWPT